MLMNKRDGQLFARLRRAEVEVGWWGVVLANTTYATQPPKQPHFNLLANRIAVSRQNNLHTVLTN
jgi:hypothetical protein